MPNGIRQAKWGMSQNVESLPVFNVSVHLIPIADWNVFKFLLLMEKGHGRIWKDGRHGSIIWLKSLLNRHAYPWTGVLNSPVSIVFTHGVCELTVPVNWNSLWPVMQKLKLQSDLFDHLNCRFIHIGSWRVRLVGEIFLNFLSPSYLEI